MNHISSYLSIKQDSANSSNYLVTLNKVYLDQKVETIVLSKLPRDQITAKNEAMQIAERSNYPFFIDRPGEIPAASYIVLGHHMYRPYKSGGN